MAVLIIEGVRFHLMKERPNVDSATSTYIIYILSSFTKDQLYIIECAATAHHVRFVQLVKYCLNFHFPYSQISLIFNGLYK